ncbi:MAG: Tex family protein [Saccharofermentanales bacterium]
MMQTQNDIFKRIADELNIRLSQVADTVALIDDKNTIPFIARYRKEVTGNLDDQVLRVLDEKLAFYRALAEKKEDVKRLIDSQGLLTDELSRLIDSCATVNEVDDLYRPFRPKRRTRAMIAIEKGLEDFALKILEGSLTKDPLEKYALGFIHPEKDVGSYEDVVAGACDILAEYISDDADLRKRLRSIVTNTGVISTKAKSKAESVYEMYYDYNEPIKRIAGHRVLAINRGEKEEFLSVKLSCDSDFVFSIIFEHCRQGKLLRGIQRNTRAASAATNASAPTGASVADSLLKPVRSDACLDIISAACKDSWKRLVEPSIETEIRNALTEDANEKAIGIFSQNLKNTLMQPPVKEKTVLGFDPAYRTGCKLAVVDPTGKCLATSVIYPHQPHNKKEESERILLSLIGQFNVDVISIGNGTASGESEQFVSGFIQRHKLDVVYCIVNEAGASVYSASELGAKEFPEYDVSLRSAVSIARRLQDPLAELVKIDPRSIGVGQYQHDMNQKKLEGSLRGVVEDCVNSVGVDLNTASPSLLSYVSGISAQISKNIVDYRDKTGIFRSRKELMKIPKLGGKTYEQCAGFLRIAESEEFLDNTSVHPESYEATKKLLGMLGNPPVGEVKKLAETFGEEKLSKTLGIGLPTLTDIIDAVSKPGRDPRGDDFDSIAANKPMEMKDLHEGMVLQGVVRNVSAFGAFVDIGVHQDGLVHISQLSDQFVKDPTTVVSAGQRVKVRVLGIDSEKKRISLSMKGM